MLKAIRLGCTMYYSSFIKFLAIYTILVSSLAVMFSYNVYGQDTYPCKLAYEEVSKEADRDSNEFIQRGIETYKEEVEGRDEFKSSLGCDPLATMLVSYRVRYLYVEQSSRFFDENITSRDFQNTTAEVSVGGTPAQGNAVPSVEPIAVAGGSFTAAGTDQGAETIVALSINPSIFIIDPENVTQSAKYGRFSDITVFFPTNAFQNNNNSLDYFGVRARINITGLSSGSAALEQAKNSFSKLVIEEDVIKEEVKNYLTDLSNPNERSKCAIDIMRDNPDQNSCNQKFNFKSLTESEKVNELKGALNDARQIADSKYFGLDLRFDYGDPSLGTVEGASGSMLYGGIAFGRKLRNQKELSYGIKGRTGINYFDQNNYSIIETNTTNDVQILDTLNVFGKTNFSFDAALGIEILRQINQQPINISSGFELRYGDAPDNQDKAFQTDYLMWRSSVNVPISSANFISLTTGIPLAGQISPIFSINANWSLLLPDIK